VSADEPSPTPSAEYVDQRLKPQLAWYEARARGAKRWRHGLASVQIISTIAIPVVNVFTHSVYVSSTLAGIAALSTAFENLFGHRDHWLGYRQTAQALETLLMRFNLSLPPFDGADKHERIITEGEAILDGEGAKWAESVKQRGGASRGPSYLIGG
jgi:Protein of unknown function (DUF4231)